MKHSVYFIRSTVFCGPVYTGKTRIDRCSWSPRLSYNYISFHSLVSFLFLFRFTVTSILVYFHIKVQQLLLFLCISTTSAESATGSFFRTHGNQKNSYSPHMYFVQYMKNKSFYAHLIFYSAFTGLETLTL